MLALIKDGTIIREVYPGGWIELPNGDFVTAAGGWANDDCALVEIEPSDPAPPGMEVVSISVQMIDGKPKYVATLRPIPVPDRVTSRQFMLQLFIDGLIDDVEAWVATQDRGVQIAFAKSGTFERHEPMMQLGFAALGYSEEQIDAFFTAASKL